MAPSENVRPAQDQAEYEDKEAEELPDPDTLPDLHLYAHSTMMYWWPVWISGYIFSIITYMQGGYIEIDQARQDVFHANSGVGLTFVLILFLVIMFTNFKLRGVYSVVLILSVALVVALLGLTGLWDEVLEFIPYLSVHMNLGFYLVFSTIIFILWAASFFVFDRISYFVVRPGQLIRMNRIGGSEETWDARGMIVEERSDDYFRHYLLGLGSGDLILMTAGAKPETIRIPNVTFADGKVDKIQRLVNVEPDSLMTHGHG